MPPDTYKSAQSFSGSRGPGHKCAKYKLYLNKIKKATPERDHPVTGRSLSDLNNSKQFRFIAGQLFRGFSLFGWHVGGKSEVGFVSSKNSLTSTKAY